MDDVEPRLRPLRRGRRRPRARPSRSATATGSSCDVRSIEAGPTDDPAELRTGDAPRPDELDGFLEFLAARDLAHPGCTAYGTAGSSANRWQIRRLLAALPAAPDGHHVYAGGLAPSQQRSASRRICRELCHCIRGCAADLLLAAAPPARRRAERVEPQPARASSTTAEGTAARPRPPRAALTEERADALDRRRRAELLHAVASPPRRARPDDRAEARRPLPREPARRGRRARGRSDGTG